MRTRALPFPVSLAAGSHRFLAAALAAGLLALPACRPETDAAPAEAPPMLVEALTVAPSTEQVRRRYAGHLHPWESHGIGFLTGGRVRTIRPEVGDRLEKGDLIATLVPDDHEVYTELASIQRDAIEPNLARVRELVEKNILPKSQLDELEAKYRAALTQHKQASIKLAQTRLTAPTSGVVMERPASVGQVVGPGLPVVILLEVERLKARFGIPQADLRWFEEGQSLTVRVPGVDAPRTGVVERIDLVPDPKTRTYGVSLALDNADGELRVGMVAHLEVVTREVSGLFVPLTSVGRTGSGAARVMVVEEDRARAREVRLGDRVGERIQVVGGLSEGERVIVKGQTFVRDGDRVRVR